MAITIYMAMYMGVYMTNDITSIWSYVYDAQDAYEAAQIVYKEAEKNMVEAAKKLSQARIDSGFSRATVLHRSFRL